MKYHLAAPSSGFTEMGDLCVEPSFVTLPFSSVFLKEEI